MGYLFSGVVGHLPLLAVLITGLILLAGRRERIGPRRLLFARLGLSVLILGSLLQFAWTLLVPTLYSRLDYSASQYGMLFSAVSLLTAVIFAAGVGLLVAALVSRDSGAGAAFAGQPFAGPPGQGQSFYGQPGHGPSFAGQPGHGQPYAAQPGHGPPFAGQPGHGQPFAAQPGQGQTFSAQPGHGPSFAGEPGQGPPLAGPPGAEGRDLPGPRGDDGVASGAGDRPGGPPSTG
ncbi:hypothetical protein [Actinoplanes nipponensis]|uniref:hypothetical protein n=1 Tax=Actinoplanes nipponensis TaxID=135950 RepID=UPI0031E8F8BF